ncbi:hypothetical protein B484DRAFT_398683 [Ochromonadaceae sp. CCMP2298]|nr:hypothetical protein B484DRAFT_398683 [Ochromonadaceae sp. CCMP2298]
MCSSRELRDAVSATMRLSQAIVVIVPCLSPAVAYGPTLKLWLHHYSPTVTSLSLRDCNFLTDAGCKLLAARFPLLERLDLSGCTNVTAAGVKKFSKGCKSLSHFRCVETKFNRKYSRVTAAYVRAIAESKKLIKFSLTLGPRRSMASALASLHQHPAIQELNLDFEGYRNISLDIHLPSLQLLRIHRGAYSTHSWRIFFQSLRISGENDGTGGRNGLRNLPNLQLLHIHSSHYNQHYNQHDQPMPQLLRPEVLAALLSSKLVSIIVSPCTNEQLSQWRALGPLNSLGQPISLTIGEPWLERV